MSEQLQITITRPDDWHLHLRDGEALPVVVPHTAAQFARAIVMPNLKPPVTHVEMAAAYRDRILRAVPSGMRFEPLMTLYLTDNTRPEEIRRAVTSGIVRAVKLYPAGATTNSDSGVSAIEKTYDVLAEMEQLGLPLLVHGEVTDPGVDIFDREAVFIDTILLPLVQRFSGLKVVMEHITTENAVQFIIGSRQGVAATITAHHLLYNRNAIFQGGVRPHYYCLPVLKREQHRKALVGAATSGSPKFFLGTDSAPHAKSTKEASCGCAGCYTAPAAIELYATAFENAGALNCLEGFSSFFGADFYGLPRNVDTVTLKKKTWHLPDGYPYLGDSLVPFGANEPLAWRLCEQ